MYEKWLSLYKEKCKTPEEAALLINNGDKVSLPTANGTPRVLWQAIAQRIAKGELTDSELTVGLNLNAPFLCTPEVAGQIHYRAGYISPFERPLAQKGIIDPWPVRFMDIPRTMMDSDYNAVTMTATPMDKNGWFSCALNCSHSYSLTRRALKNGKPMKIFLEVNKNAPYVYGHNHFHISEVTAIVEADWELIAPPRAEICQQDVAIASYIAEQIPDGACVQLGIGGLPDAVGKQLTNKKDLGCHTEMIVDAYLDLYKAGALTNRKKTFMEDKMVGSIVIGQPDLYEFVNQNPGVEVHGIDFCADPGNIAKNENFMAINAITECDLGGQCISESMGYVPYSGIGGQADFVQGAWQSKGGKAFLALYSSFTDKNGQNHSKISPVVNGWVGISRWDVQYLVTEYGCVYLKGTSMRERVQKVVSIAHPDFREWLVSEAKRLHLIDSASDINIRHMRKEI